MAKRSYKPELVGVFGFPVAENPTVVMMEAAFDHLNIDWRYLTIEVKPGDLEAAIGGVRAFNMRGINLTIPHKIEVMKYLDEIADDARLIGAVNTVVNEGGKLRGENTDGKGFLRSLKEEYENGVKGAKVFLLGAGGAARAIAVELALAGAEEIMIVNRSKEKGESLARTLRDNTSCNVSYIPWSGELKIPERIQILINATSIGLFPATTEFPDIDYETIRSDMMVCDVIPNPPHTEFLTRASKCGAKTIDGLGMLVNQGVIGFKLWTGMDAPRQVMIDALSREFGV